MPIKHDEFGKFTSIIVRHSVVISQASNCSHMLGLRTCSESRNSKTSEVSSRDDLQNRNSSQAPLSFSSTATNYCGDSSAVRGHIVWECRLLQFRGQRLRNNNNFIILNVFSSYRAQNDDTHIFMVWELISQLHRTSVTQGVLAGILLCNWALAQGTFCESANYAH